MGGNARVIDRQTGKVTAKAEKVNLRKFSRTHLRRVVLHTLQTLDNLYKRRYKSPIWKDFGVVKRGETFSGSTLHLFDPKILNETFVTYRESVGDIDVIVPKEIKENFEQLMQSLEGKMTIRPIEGHFVKYLGQDRADFGATFLGVFRYSIPGKGLSVNFQIDFEYGEYREGKPTPWAKFSHSASWGDMVTGLKGVHHKFLLINLVRAVSKRENVIVATPSSTADKLRIVTGKKASQLPRVLAFSVDRGLRVKYAPMTSKGKPVLYEGKEVLKEIDVEDSSYVTEPELIFFHVFGKVPSSSDLTLFSSFWGLILLIQRHLSNAQIEDLFDYLVQENMYGKYAQVIEKNNAELDMRVKEKMVNTLYSVFSFLASKKEKVDKMKSEYYEIHYKRHAHA